MIKSMTGFGRCEITEGEKRYTVEMKSVNHRYLEMNIKMPKALNFFESSIRTELKKYMERGKVDLYITYEDLGEESGALKYNSALAKEYMQYFQQMAEEFGIENDVRVSTLSRCPEVLTMEENKTDEEELWKGLQKAVDGAAEQFVESRIKEGDNLTADLLSKLDFMLELVSFIEERAPQIIREYREKLTAKVRDLLDDKQVDEARLLTEVTLFADKVCVDEEIVRLKSHVSACRDTLKAGGSCGRKLDFLAQEMNRESNTILSKTTDIETSNRAIELKNTIEKVREQIQNIE